MNDIQFTVNLECCDIICRSCVCVCPLQPVQDPRLLDVAVLVHSRPLFECTVDPSVSEVNLMFHMWAFQGERGGWESESGRGVIILEVHWCFMCLLSSNQGIKFAEGRETHLTMEMGVFGPQGVRETRQNICEELNGVAVGRMGPRILYMVRDSLIPTLPL